MRNFVFVVGALAVLATAPAQAIEVNDFAGVDPRHSLGGPSDTATCSGGSSCTTGTHNYYYVGSNFVHGFRGSDNLRFSGNVESKITQPVTGAFQTVTCSMATGNPSCYTQGATPPGQVVHTCRLINGFGTWTCFITHGAVPVCPGAPICSLFP